MGRRRVGAGWANQGHGWRGWLRRSPRAVELLTWLQEPDAYVGLVGDDRYREYVLELLHAAEPRDCAAAGMGCRRRNDRTCRDPGTCALDPPAPGEERPGDDYGVGPRPGGCDGYYGYLGQQQIYVWFSADRRRRAVFWCPERGEIRLWVDGAPAGVGVRMDSTSDWVADRFLVVHAEGPDEHPKQHYGPGRLVSRILSVLVYDAELGSERLLHPLPTEEWTSPLVEWVDGRLLVYPDEVAQRAGRPDREVPVLADPPAQVG